MSSTTDRITKTVFLRAPQERVWRAISDTREFGSGFGVEFDGPFVAGTQLSGRVVPTTVDAEAAKAQEPYVGIVFKVVVERVEPMRLLSFRWHPGAVVPEDLDAEPMTLVQFELAAGKDGTTLTIVESGFDAIPLARRAEAFKTNEDGWNHQVRLIGKYLERQLPA